ncbi:MAG TPA: Rne/Rng family ribonuclease [Acidimicrobiales bacterium]|nr:Rne/Rng family ribonuclease [Acidimicrobiales bacterium]
MSDSASARPEDFGAEDSTSPEEDQLPREPTSSNTTGSGTTAARRRRRGSRGGRNRNRNSNRTSEKTGATDQAEGSNGEPPERAAQATSPGPAPPAQPTGDLPPKPKIGDTRPAPPSAPPRTAARQTGDQDSPNSDRSRRRKRGSRGRTPQNDRRPVEAVLVDEPVELDEETLERRRGRERKGRPVGRYLMVVHKGESATQIAVLEGRALIELYVSRAADDATQIDGNIYLGRVQNVLPGMEAAFVDIGTPKNAVLYRGDVRYDKDDVEPTDDSASSPTRGRLEGPARDARIEQLLKTGQTILCQVTKNPIGTKGARLTQEVSLPGRFVVLIPNSDTYGISKRLPDEERKRLRRILDEIRPSGHGLIVRTAAEGATADELRRDVSRLCQQWEKIDALAKTARTPALLYREPDMAVRVIREEFNRDYREVVIDDPNLYEEVRDYVASINPELADRVEWAGESDDPLPVFERYHVHEQIHKALDRKVWLPSGGSLIIERTEALTVIDVNTGKNVGTSNLEETVFRNNMEAADEIARQLRLRDIGGIIVIDFIDMEISANRAEVVKRFRAALARDKTRTQVFDISELGLVEMTRKRISEGLVESFSETCPTCGGRGIIFDQSLL